MKSLWLAFFLACGIAAAPLSYAEEGSAPPDTPQKDQKAGGEKNGDKEAGKKKGEKKKDGEKKDGAGDEDPSCD